MRFVKMRFYYTKQICKRIHNRESVVDKNDLINCCQKAQFLLEKFHVFSHLKNWKLDL